MTPQSLSGIGKIDDLTNNLTNSDRSLQICQDAGNRFADVGKSVRHLSALSFAPKYGRVEKYFGGNPIRKTGI